VRVTETPSTLEATVPLRSGGNLGVVFRERGIDLRLDSDAGGRVAMLFEWVPELSALRSVQEHRLSYRFRDFDYALGIRDGVASPTPDGARIAGNGPQLQMVLAQDATV